MSEKLTSELSNSENAVMSALAFARETSKNEIEAIDRLHKRTLSSLSILTGLLAVALSVFGWIGFANLKRVAVATASDVVRQRLDDALTQRQIDSAVKSELSHHAEAQISESVKNQIDETVRREIERGTPELGKRLEIATNRSIQELEPQIVAYAKHQAELLVKQTNAPRILTTEQMAKLTDCAKIHGKLTIPIDVGGDAEAQNFSAVLSKAFAAGGWQTAGTSLLSGHPELPRYGVIVAVTPSTRKSALARAAMSCLEQGLVGAVLTEVPENEEWGPGPVDIIVQPKAR